LRTGTAGDPPQPEIYSKTLLFEDGDFVNFSQQIKILFSHLLKIAILFYKLTNMVK